MKTLCVAAGAALLASNLAGFAQTEAACGQAFDVPLRSRAVLSIDSRPAGLEIVGTDKEEIHVSCTAQEGEDPSDVTIRFSGKPDDGKLKISGGSSKKGNFRVHIEVPRKTNLRVEMSAGEVKVEEIAGDKDIDLYAGQITISSTHALDYKSVHLSVDIGEVRAPVYDTEKGGFFRSINKKEANGEYWLHAHVMTGEIDLLGKEDAAD